MTIYIRLIRTHNFSARLIHIGMWLWAVIRLRKPQLTYNHCEVGSADVTSGAIAEGVKTRMWVAYVAEHKGKYFKFIEYRVKLKPHEWNRGRYYLAKAEGTKYEYSNFIWHTIKIVIGKWIGNRTDKKLFCYEHGIRFLNATGRYNLNPYLNPYEFKTWADKNLKK